MESKILYPVPGFTYLHYKGGLYEVITLAEHSETKEKLVVYKSTLFGGVYVRPLSMWFEKIEIDGLTKVRFFGQTSCELKFN